MVAPRPFVLFPETVISDLECIAWEGSHEHGWSRPAQLRQVVELGGIGPPPMPR